MCGLLNNYILLLKKKNIYIYIFFKIFFISPPSHSSGGTGSIDYEAPLPVCVHMFIHRILTQTKGHNRHFFCQFNLFDLEIWVKGHKPKDW